MFNQNHLQELLSFDAGNKKVVSLYLDTNSSRQTVEAIRLQARNLLKEVSPELQADATVIERFLDHSYDWSKPGLAIFSCAALDFFAAYPVAVPFRNRIRLSHKPYVKHLAHFLDYYAAYGVILVDRLGARFFAYNLGDLQETEGFMGEDVRKLKTGQGSSEVGMRGAGGRSRHEEEVVQRNFREAAAEANRFFARWPIRRLFLGGAAATLPQFREVLTKQLQSCIAGTFAIDMDAAESEVCHKALALLTAVNEEREQQLVSSLVSLKAQGGNGVLGLDDTLQAICDKRVQTLVISDGFHAPGYKDEAMQFVVANLARSPLSDTELVEVDDVVDTAVAYTMGQGGHVEVISNNVTLEAVGRIGAILRY